MLRVHFGPFEGQKLSIVRMLFLRFLPGHKLLDKPCNLGPVGKEKVIFKVNYLKVEFSNY